MSKSNKLYDYYPLLVDYPAGWKQLNSMAYGRVVYIFRCIVLCLVLSTPAMVTHLYKTHNKSTKNCISTHIECRLQFALDHFGGQIVYFNLHYTQHYYEYATALENDYCDYLLSYFHWNAKLMCG